MKVLLHLNLAFPCCVMNSGKIGSVESNGQNSWGEKKGIYSNDTDDRVPLEFCYSLEDSICFCLGRSIRMTTFPDTFRRAKFCKH